MGTKYQGSSKLVSSEYLYKSLMQLDAKRDKVLQDGLDGELYIYTVDHYEVCTSSDDGALLIVDDAVASPSDGEIKLSDVNPIQPDGTVVNVGEYVKFVASQKTNETKFVKRNEISVDTVSKLSTIEEELEDGSKKEVLTFNGTKIEAKIDLDDAPTKDSDKFVNSGAVYSSLFTTKQRTVIDVAENYTRCASGDSDAILVDSSNIDAIRVFIEDIADGEYVQHIEEQSHTEDYEDNLYRLKDDSYSAQEIDKKLIEIASGGLQPWELSEYQDYIDNLVVTAAGFVEPTP